MAKGEILQHTRAALRELAYRPLAPTSVIDGNATYISRNGVSVLTVGSDHDVFEHRILPSRLRVVPAKGEQAIEGTFKAGRRGRLIVDGTRGEKENARKFERKDYGDPLVNTFVDIAEIAEMHPNEHAVLAYVKDRLQAAGVEYKQDEIGNIVATIPGKDTANPLALVAHVDLALPPKGRKVIVEEDKIRTDGKSILGGDDLSAVACFLELSDIVHKQGIEPERTLELVFTVGEEVGLNGARHLVKEAQAGRGLITAQQAIVFDWTGAVNEIVRKSPGHYNINVDYIGKAAHTGLWQDGINAGAALAEAIAGLQQGEYADGVLLNIGRFEAGEVKNQVAGKGSARGEGRSHDDEALDRCVNEVKERFEAIARAHGVKAAVELVRTASAYTLDEESALFARVKEVLGEIGQETTLRDALEDIRREPNLQDVYGVYDANVLTAIIPEIVIAGAAYHHPHTPEEYLDRKEFSELATFINRIAGVQIASRTGGYR